MSRKRLENEMVELRAKLEVDRRMAAIKLIPRRSEMSAAEKSAYIRKRITQGRTGQQAMSDYFSLPWD